MNYFSKIAESQTVLHHIVGKLVTYIDHGNTLALKSMFNALEIEPYQYRDAFRQLVVGAVIGGHRIPKEQLDPIDLQLSMENIRRRKI